MRSLSIVVGVALARDVRVHLFPSGEAWGSFPR